MGRGGYKPSSPFGGPLRREGKPWPFLTSGGSKAHFAKTKPRRRSACCEVKRPSAFLDLATSAFGQMTSSRLTGRTSPKSKLGRRRAAS
ncbi:hypothetical protein PGTUg99_020752 [Puccinia graminis f. sp. tritici]|uniref:Uncharacterized protein n=1 Tax=Puccinia graminis f. sp. tritici TaxID=56615 RepID=A0A5B0SEX2_PUCGR|nr:hypothetical protein PGTUg99_020752 [Puccinia graminis f. sp. tritici]